MSAIRLARAFTRRKSSIKFEGCYHGHADGLLVKAGSGVATFGIPGSAGVPEEIAHFTLALPYNDLAAVEAAFAARPDEIACVIVEPVVGNMGCVPPAPGYLAGLRAHPPRRRASDLRRGDDRLPRRARRSAADFTASRPTYLPRQDHRRRPALRRLRRHAPSDGPARPARPRLPGRHAQRQPAGHGRGRCVTLRHLARTAKESTAIWRRQAGWLPKA